MTRPADDSGALGRRRNSWDYVRETKRRQQAAADADYRQRVDGTPDRPTDTWRVCGNPIAPGEGSGCTCTTAPNRWTAQRALARLNTQEGGPVPAAPRTGPVAGKAPR